MTGDRIYVAVDLKSFYASVECVERGLDPLTTNLLVADSSRTEKTICLAVSPALKRYGIPGRARLFEAIQKVKAANASRIQKAPGGVFRGSSYCSTELDQDPSLAIDYITAPPHMALYMSYSVRIYGIYLRYIAPEDIHVYSVDEVFMDVTGYLKLHGLSVHDFSRMVIRDVLQETGITATVGIGTNLYLCKVAMDIVAKKAEADADGVRIAALDELSYRELLWSHRPLTDFWRVGRGYARKLEGHGLYTMGDVARCSIGKSTDYYNEDLLYRMFGVNAELLIDHAWGWEPCTMAEVKAYKPESNSLGSGQVLQEPYTWEKARIIVQEMTDLLVLDLVDKKLVTDQVVLTVGYDIENLADPARKKAYTGPLRIDHYGRKVPQHAHGTANLGEYTSSTKQIMKAMLELYDRIADKSLLVRRITITANHVVDENTVEERPGFEQLSLFCDYDTEQTMRDRKKAMLEREKRIQKAVLEIKKKHGKNAILKGMNLQEGAMTRERNLQVGGHKA